MTLTEAQAALDEATENYRVATEQLNAYRRVECDASNRLIHAQTAFDTVVAAIRKAAPRGSDWARVNT
jgi:hypothetical protein